MNQRIVVGLGVILGSITPVLGSSVGGTSGGEVLSIPVAPAPSVWGSIYGDGR